MVRLWEIHLQMVGFPIAMLQMFDYETVAMRCTQFF